MVKNRDFVYMESTGVDYLHNGERVGYQLIHSVQFLGTPPLSQYIRGNMSMCAVYRQKDPYSTEVFIKGYLNPAGGLMRSIVLHSAAAALLSVSKNVYCAQMKKLVWTIRNRRLTIVCGSSAGMAKVSDRCVNCKTSPKLTDTLLDGKKRRRTCKICFRYVCKSCREEAMSAETLAVARDEVASQADVFEWNDTYTSSSGTELVPIDDLNDH
ncbi:hypothetical protein BBJ29_006840 [Phytophthora kernoviae]|uniref:FYVE-type domain-containing protein n=1 Tax=Phytophthora kernoviae TaxID=325452 RepID=A0A3F2RH88_9STRA|nr:hypothetical protein BBP00_00008523 [Phytophthora kernoviae]RLN66053.1 hypothetical protein BBJ29_006840 [Phytophthora kernoviae]